MKILLAVDGSNTTKHMLAKLAARDELLGPGHHYTALTVVMPISAHASSLLPAGAIEGWHQEQAEQVLGPVRAFAAQSAWDLQTRFVVGHAGDAIAQVAEEGKFDLIVMGTHGHSSLANVVLGSIATRVLARTKLPVLLVR
jgi:nucleotide-binding universal stress UspA family protein